MRKTILMLDDREMFLYIARSHLASRGFNVLLARNESQFMSIISRRRVDLVLLDVNLGPKGDEGIALLRWLRAVDLALPVIMISSDIEKWQQCSELGANFFSPKPVNYEDLSRQIDRIFTKVAS